MSLIDSAKNNTEYQKKFIITNSKFLSEPGKLLIIDKIMDSVKTDYAGENVFLESTSKSKAVYINLDALEKIDDSIITEIYNIVRTRRDALNTPSVS